MSLGFECTVCSKLEAVKGDVNKVFVKKEVLTLFIRKDDHKRLDQRITHMNLYQFNVLRVDLLNLNSFIVL